MSSQGWSPVTSAGEPRSDPCVPVLLDVMGGGCCHGLGGAGASLASASLLGQRWPLVLTTPERPGSLGTSSQWGTQQAGKEEGQAKSNREKSLSSAPGSAQHQEPEVGDCAQPGTVPVPQEGRW